MITCLCGQPGTQGVFCPPPPGQVSWSVLVSCDTHALSQAEVDAVDGFPAPVTLARIEAAS